MVDLLICPGDVENLVASAFDKVSVLCEDVPDLETALSILGVGCRPQGTTFLEYDQVIYIIIIAIVLAGMTLTGNMIAFDFARTILTFGVSRLSNPIFLLEAFFLPYGTSRQTLASQAAYLFLLF